MLVSSDFSILARFSNSTQAGGWVELLPNDEYEFIAGLDGVRTSGARFITIGR